MTTNLPDTSASGSSPSGEDGMSTVPAVSQRWKQSKGGDDGDDGAPVPPALTSAYTGQLLQEHERAKTMPWSGRGARRSSRSRRRPGEAHVEVVAAAEPPGPFEHVQWEAAAPRREPGGRDMTLPQVHSTWTSATVTNSRAASRTESIEWALKPRPVQYKRTKKHPQRRGPEEAHVGGPQPPTHGPVTHVQWEAAAAPRLPGASLGAAT